MQYYGIQISDDMIVRLFRDRESRDRWVAHNPGIRSNITTRELKLNPRGLECGGECGGECYVRCTWAGQIVWTRAVLLA